MSNIKYVAIDVSQASCVFAVHSFAGKRLFRTVIETSANSIREFLGRLKGEIHLTFEEGTQSAWLYDLTRPLVRTVTVCDPRRNRLLSSGNKSDLIDADKLADLLRAGLLSPVYHGEASVRKLKELAHCYQSFVSDTTRVMNRIKAIYRSYAVFSGGREVYYKRNREAWLCRLTHPGVRIRAELFYGQLDELQQLRRQARKLLLLESRHHRINKILRQIPGVGPLRAAFLIAAIATPNRFRTKRQLWSYSGLAVVSRSSGDYILRDGIIQRKRKLSFPCGLNRNYNRTLKEVFKGAATEAIRKDPFRAYYGKLIAKGIRPELARLTVARKIAAIVLTLWKKGESFKEEKICAA